jgi:hypothetical protein
MKLNLIKSEININKLRNKIYFSRLLYFKTVYIYTWPTYKFKDNNNLETSNLDKKDNITKNKNNSKIIDELRRLLIKKKFYVEAISAQTLRKLGFNIYGPIVAISAIYSTNEFDKKVKDIVQELFDLEPICFFKDGVYFPDITLFNENYLKAQTVYSRRNNLFTIPVINNVNFVKKVVNLNNTIIINIIRICSRPK